MLYSVFVCVMPIKTQTSSWRRSNACTHVKDACSGLGSGLRFAPCNYALVVSNLCVLSSQRLSHRCHIYSMLSNCWQLHIPVIFFEAHFKQNMWNSWLTLISQTNLTMQNLQERWEKSLYCVIWGPPKWSCRWVSAKTGLVFPLILSIRQNKDRVRDCFGHGLRALSGTKDLKAQLFSYGRPWSKVLSNWGLWSNLCQLKDLFWLRRSGSCRIFRFGI